MTAATTVRVGPCGYRGEDASAVDPAAPKLGSGPVGVGTGLASTIITEAAAYANQKTMNPSSALPGTDCSRRGSLLVVEGCYNAG